MGWNWGKWELGNREDWIFIGLFCFACVEGFGSERIQFADCILILSGDVD